MGIKISAPAVAFDDGRLRTYLETEADNPYDEFDDAPYTHAEQLGLTTGDLTDLHQVDEFLETLADPPDDLTDVWALDPGVKAVGIFRTYSDGDCDGALVHVDLDNGLRLASLHQDPADFTRADFVDGIVEALNHIAWLANQLYADYRRLHPPGRVGEVTFRQVVLEPIRDAEIAELERLLGYRVRQGRDPRHLDRLCLDKHHDLDAVVGFARTTGVHYVETVETVYEEAQ